MPSNPVLDEAEDFDLDLRVEPAPATQVHALSAQPSPAYTIDLTCVHTVCPTICGGC